MVKHIVFWRLRTELTAAEREAAYGRFKAGFEDLLGKIPGLRTVQIGKDFGQGADAADIVLYSEFDSPAALAAYDTHALHTALVPMVREVRTEKRVVDFEL